MSRSGYIDEYNPQMTNLWRGVVASAIRGRNGQAFLKELLAALDALPEKKLITKELEADGSVCALGALGKARGTDMKEVDPENYYQVARIFGVRECLAQEIVWENDEGVGYWMKETPEARFTRMRNWVVSKIKAE